MASVAPAVLDCALALLPKLASTEATVAAARPLAPFQPELPRAALA